MLVPFWLVLAAAAPAQTVTPFRTSVAPRIDPVFGDSTSLRKTVDRFLTVHTEMEQVRNDFSTAVHGTLSEVAKANAPKTPKANRVCPTNAASLYGRALDAGGRYLALGRELEARFRDIRRADDLGDAAGLTPDYRLKVKQVQQLHTDVMRDLQEMRVAFYEQLSAEMRHAGCVLSETNRPVPAGADSSVAVDPSDPAAWTLEDTSPDPEASGKPEATRVVKPSTQATTAPAVWIEIDNSHCARASQLIIDGTAYGQVAGHKKTAVRTHAGPHEICVLPTTEKRTCGDSGTLRQAYFYEGWSLVVRCDK
jgi:hypothetical protein